MYEESHCSLLVADKSLSCCHVAAAVVWAHSLVTEKPSAPCLCLSHLCLVTTTTTILPDFTTCAI